MSDEKEFGLTNVGTDGVIKVPVDAPRERTALEKEVDREIIELAKKDPKALLAQFDETSAIVVPAKKKRGRPAKKTVAPVTSVEPLKEEVAKEWYCSTCRETIDDKNVMKIGAGTNRWAVFCPQCQRSFGFQDQEVLDKVAAFVKDNPTGKNAKA